MKKFFIKICKLLGYEILDQNNFSSPTLGKELNEELSILNEKSIVLPLGEVKITKKVNSILIVLRMNTDIEIWDQNRRRLFEYPKIEYTFFVILTSPKGKTIDFSFKIDNSSFNSFPNVGDEKLF